MDPVPSSRYVWKNPDDDDDDNDNDNNTASDDHAQNDQSKAKETYDSVLQSFLAEPPPPKSLATLCANSLVVGQEFSLTCLFWARHRVTLWQDNDDNYDMHHSYQQHVKHQEALQQRMIQSQLMALVALIVIASYTNSSASPPQPQPRKAKIQQRTSDAILLGVLLWLSAGVLRSLTASYSADTVESLTLAGLIIHWLTCDYSYANATESRESNESKSNSNNDSEKQELGKKAEALIRHDGVTSSQRPTFQGGTVSLNAAFFSTTLLASRLSSNATVYIFVSSAIIFFAFFPAARHAISHHPRRALSK